MGQHYIRLPEKEAAEPQSAVLSFKATCRRGVLEERLLSGRVLLGVLQQHGLCSIEGVRTCFWPACVQECKGCALLCESARAFSAESAWEAALGWTFEIRSTDNMSPVPSCFVLRLLCSGQNRSPAMALSFAALQRVHCKQPQYAVHGFSSARSAY